MRFLPRILAAAAVLSAVVSCSGTDAVSQSVAGSAGYQGGNPALTRLAVGHRPLVRGVSGTLLDGRPFDLSQWRGRVVVVNFWGSWCGPCHDEADALQQVYADNRASGVEFLGINVRDDPASGLAFQREFKVTYPSLNDPSNLLALRFPNVPPSATPTTVVLDRNGRIAARQSSAILYSQLRDLVRQVLAEPA